MSYRMLDGPSGARIDADSGRLTWEQPQAGEQTFRIEVDDGHGGRSEQRFTVLFANAQAPCESDDGCGILMAPTPATAAAVTIDWDGKEPSCFAGARFPQSSWLGEFLGVKPTERALSDWPALQIRVAS